MQKTNKQKQKNVTGIQEKKQSTKTVSEVAQMLAVTDTDIKAAVINMFRKLKRIKEYFKYDNNV